MPVQRMDEAILRMLGALAADNADEELCSQVGKLMDHNSEIQDEFLQSQSCEEGLLFPIMTLPMARMEGKVDSLLREIEACKITRGIIPRLLVSP